MASGGGSNYDLTLLPLRMESLGRGPIALNYVKRTLSSCS